MSDWMKGIDEKALERSLSVGEILPKLMLPKIEAGKTTSEETLFIKFLEEPKFVENENFPGGKAYIAIVEHQGARKSLVIPESLRFNLAKEMKLHNLDTILNKNFIVGASLQDMKARPGKAGRKDVKLYWCQYKEKNESNLQTGSDEESDPAGDFS